VCKDFYPADRLMHDITLALMATQTTEGLDTFYFSASLSASGIPLGPRTANIPNSLPSLSKEN